MVSANHASNNWPQIVQLSSNVIGCENSSSDWSVVVSRCDLPVQRVSFHADCKARGGSGSDGRYVVYGDM